MAMKVIRGKIQSAKKVVVYGPEGIGKSTFASSFPDPIFIDVEGSTSHMDVARTERPSSFSMLLEQVRYFIAHPSELKTLVIDTADWAERLCIEEVCAQYQKKGIEDFGYGKGYVYVYERFGDLLNLCTTLVERGVNVVITAHAIMRKFEQPDEMGSYDRWELKLGKKTGSQTAPILKEWSDLLLFANYKTFVINVDDQGAAKGKNKVQGGKRVMFTTHHPCWDAKNRFGLPEELPFEYAKIAHLFLPAENPKKLQEPANLVSDPTDKIPEKLPEPPETPILPAELTPKEEDAPKQQPDPSADPDEEGIPKALLDLMHANGVRPAEIQMACSLNRKYYPADMPIRDYEPDFIKGCLIGAWDTVFGFVKQNRDNNPFLNN